jgi:uncharacterized membrane protein
VIVYSFVIWSMRLTRTPELSGLMYFLIGLSALLSPLVLRESSYRKALGWLAIAFLVIAAAIAIYIGANAAFGHVAGWAVSVFIIICSAHVHWFLRPLNAMRYAESHEISKYERR